MMGEPLLIGLDLGTTNGKTACYDASGRLLAESIHSYPTHFPQPGWYEQDPANWIGAFEAGLKDVAAKLDTLSQNIAGIALSNFGPGLVLMDQDGNSLAPCPTWQDERCRSYGQLLVDAVGSSWIGLGPPLNSLPAKLFWALKETPELIARAKMVTDIKGFLMTWLTGRAVTDPSSGPGGKTWSEPVFDYIGWPRSRLPRVLAATESTGNLREDLAHRVGLKPGIPVFTGVNDGAAATIGSGAVNLGNSVITLATNGACRLVISKKLDPEVLLARNMFSWPLVEERWICGGFTCSGAGSLQWLADQFGLPRDPVLYEALLQQASTVPPGSRGVLFLPYLSGRGTPQARPELRGGFLNLGLEHGRKEMTRAVLEGIAFALREIYAEFKHQELDIGTIHITGGGARSKLWRQIVASVLDRPVILASGDSTLGDAMIAAVGLGLYANISSAASKMVTIQESENPCQAETYNKLYTAFVQTRDQLIEIPYIKSSEMNSVSGGPK
jgi:xylulokinase